MFALVVNGVVVQIESETFPVTPEFIWVECDESVKTGWLYDGTFSEPPPPS